ncbi:MAG: hypothetical protein WBI53_13100 [Paludibacter sp.]
MKTKIEKKQKRVYYKPFIETILLDNEISLSLDSLPPVPTNEGQQNAPQYFNNDPFK